MTLWSKASYAEKVWTGALFELVRVHPKKTVRYMLARFPRSRTALGKLVSQEPLAGLAMLTRLEVRS